MGDVTKAYTAGKSDIGFKEGLVPLGVYHGLPVYAFRYKDDPETIQMGVVAQEVEQIAPDCVVRGSDGFLRVYYDRLFERFGLEEALCG